MQSNRVKNESSTAAKDQRRQDVTPACNSTNNRVSLVMSWIKEIIILQYNKELSKKCCDNYLKCVLGKS
ncbi:hypothetical protein AALO_G00256900 [Alosa alosa]|uniref:Uncharacterized protein n=1 Tax=Alosa alosa TaxID=278164 RepID=A0AAV6FWC3_9TELE|nr:hypothetical protein AALO_G00256900 [Alosa alosa]